MHGGMIQHTQLPCEATLFLGLRVARGRTGRPSPQKPTQTTEGTHCAATQQLFIAAGQSLRLSNPAQRLSPGPKISF
ncbi:hypothetical protein D4764_19G0009460 [Takifugu flavidus]|uniref:Uncharacterized protein n=1 Tax=Takifugu flavidus TaxID=433684 RepID=A0A5C6NU65_9TELE|nr:hypothetical protein D4764_19G0009460 [Takifugu flavidus]